MNSERTQAEPPGPFKLNRYNSLCHVRDALERNGYTKAALVEINRRKPGEKLDACLVKRRISTPSPLHTLVALFFLGQPVRRDDLGCALEAPIIEELLTIGLLQQTSAGIRSLAFLMLENDILVAHDFPTEVTGLPLAADYVLGVGRASQTLANMTVRRRSELVLDLGTGSGIQALLAAKHGARVIGTDVSSRALNFAELNACLNGISNLELRRGGLYEPVQQEQFDLILANPPFIISPATRYVYRDSSLPGDTISQQVITGAPPRLREGGFSIVLFNWHHDSDQDCFERPQQWVESTGCDAWLLCLASEDPLSYAAVWLRSSDEHGDKDYGQHLDEWMRYYAQMGIRRISSGVMILRRRNAQKNWIRTDAYPLDLQNGSCSDQILRIFNAQDVLENLRDDRKLLDVKFVLAPDHEMEHYLHVEDRNWRVTDAQLKLKGGLAFSGYVDRLVSTMIAGCDGNHLLRELIEDLARDLNLNFESIVPACLAAVQKLMRSGLLSVQN